MAGAWDDGNGRKEPGLRKASFNGVDFEMLKQVDIADRLRVTVEEFIEDWGLDAAVTPETRLVEDLEFDSIDVIQLVVAIERAFDSRSLGFQDLLMKEGRYVDDLSLAQIEAFLEQRLARA